ncbi:PREDICTED: cytidine deaminase 1-like [Nelumbo nucifera]|uniref:cytidine deaminase n=1 Tax=Nelumbo nucifera TaxID=4432 RepID=A0A1U8AMH0_NELNU|nr:PREDICTED: cytidine deaminase 1-like [Nelumbo nucifera]
MEQARFVIESADVESMAKESGLSLLQLLTSLVKSTQDLARPPISKYHVGAVGLGSDGRVFLGVNLEFPGLPLHHSVHAEQFLITNAAIHGSTRLRYIAVSSAPCGHCRQFMQEIRGASDINILVTSTENEGDNREDVAFRPMSHFLPQRFGPDDLLNKDVPLLLEPHHNGLTFSDDHDEINGEANRCYSNDSVVADYNKLKYAALEAANKSHAPYSGCPSGVALMDMEGKIYKGSYAESAAYNPSLGPVQAALVVYVAAGGGGYEKIVAGALVEKEGAVVGQEGTARLLLQSVSPRCDFVVFHCNSASSTCKKPC